MITYSLAFLAFFFSMVLVPCPMYYKLLISGCFMLLMNEKHALKLANHHIMFLVWMAWILICCWFSDYRYISMVGYHLRVEGLLTWIVMASLAYFYWVTFAERDAMSILCLVVMLLTVTGLNILSTDMFNLIAFTPVALGSICCVMFILFWSVSPAASILVVPFFIASNSRSAIVASIVAVAVYSLLKSKDAKKLTIYATLALLIISAVIYCTPLKQKFSNIKVGSIGTGARSHWIKEGAKQSLHLPITGYGLDVLANYLTPAPTSEYRQRNANCDKTHFLVMDILLMTGWIGLGIFSVMAWYALKTAYYYRSDHNITCFSVLVAWFVFGMFNPTGMYSTMIAIWAFIGLRKHEPID